MVYLLREGIKRREVIIIIFPPSPSFSPAVYKPHGSGWLSLVGLACLEETGWASCPAQKVFVLPQVQMQQPLMACGCTGSGAGT